MQTFLSFVKGSIFHYKYVNAPATCRRNTRLNMLGLGIYESIQSK